MSIEAEMTIDERRKCLRKVQKRHLPADLALDPPHNPARHLEAGAKLSAGLRMVTLCRKDLRAFVLGDGWMKV